jgi:hypothetical protein
MVIKEQQQQEQETWQNLSMVDSANLEQRCTIDSMVFGSLQCSLCQLTSLAE